MEEFPAPNLHMIALMCQSSGLTVSGERAFSGRGQCATSAQRRLGMTRLKLIWVILGEKVFYQGSR